MINNNILSDRLNNFKNNKNSPKEDKSSSQLSQNPLFNLISTFSLVLIHIIKIIVYGYSIKLIFSTNWDFLSTICVGLALNFFLEYLYDLIHKKL